MKPFLIINNYVYIIFDFNKNTISRILKWESSLFEPKLRYGFKQIKRTITNRSRYRIFI